MVKGAHVYRSNEGMTIKGLLTSERLSCLGLLEITGEPLLCSIIFSHLTEPRDDSGPTYQNVLSCVRLLR